MHAYSGKLGQGDTPINASRIRAEAVARFLLAYFAVVIGILAKGAWDPLLAAKSGGTIVLPQSSALFATIVLDLILGFLALNKIHQRLPERTTFGLTLVVAFENGFFWQALVGPAVGGTGV